MPCYDERNDPAYQIAEARKDWVHNSPVAELLCGLLTSMTNLERAPFLAMQPRLRAWWIEHQKRDADKVKREQKLHADEQERIKQQIADLQKKLKKPR